MPFLRLQMLKEALREYRANRPMELSAALSYYTLLSLAPIVLVTVAVSGLVFGRDAVQGRLVAQMRGLVGEPGAEVIQNVLSNARDPAQGAFSLIVGIVVLLVGAMAVFVQLQDALNRIWDVEAKPRKSAIWGFVRIRLLSLAMIVGVGFLLLVSLFISTALAAFGDWAGGSMTEHPVLVQVVNTILSLGVITLLFAMVYRILPDAKVAWRDVWFGAITTAVLFTIGKHLIGLYLGRASVGSAYGAAGSTIVLMVWTYYASAIVLFGAELTHVRSKLVHHHRAEPMEHAVATVPAQAHRDEVIPAKAPAKAAAKKPAKKRAARRER